MTSPNENEAKKSCNRRRRSLRISTARQRWANWLLPSHTKLISLSPPLSPMGRSAFRLLDRDEPDTHEVRDALQRIVGGSKRASEIIQRLRALYKKTDPQMAPLDINGVITEVIPLMQHDLRSQGVCLQLEMTPSPLSILGDRIQLQQVIMNLSAQRHGCDRVRRRWAT